MFLEIGGSYGVTCGESVFSSRSDEFSSMSANFLGGPRKISEEKKIRVDAEKTDSPQGSLTAIIDTSPPVRSKFSNLERTSGAMKRKS